MIEDLKVMSYLLKEDKEQAIITTLERAFKRDSNDKWAIRALGHCLNKYGFWEFEVLPSNRDDDFLERCRWNTAEEALEFWKKYKDLKKN